jgi:hypothetical protein
MPLLSSIPLTLCRARYYACNSICIILISLGAAFVAWVWRMEIFAICSSIVFLAMPIPLRYANTRHRCNLTSSHRYSNFSCHLLREISIPRPRESLIYSISNILAISSLPLVNFHLVPSAPHQPSSQQSSDHSNVPSLDPLA